MATNDNFHIRDIRKSPFVWYDRAIIEKYGRDLGPFGHSVYAALCLHADNKGQTCTPSYKTIAEYYGMSRRQVLRELDKLVELGLVAKTTRKVKSEDKKNNLTNEYTLLDLPGLVTMSHQAGDYESPRSDYQSPGVVTTSHPNYTHEINTNITTAVACAEQPKATPNQEPKTHAQPDLPDTRANHLPRRPNRGEGDRIAEYYAAKIGQDKDSLSRRDYELIGQLVTDGFTLEHCQPHIDRICTEVWARGAEIRSFGIFVKAIRQLDPRKQAPVKAPIRGVDIPKLYKVSNDPADFPDDRGFLRIIQSRKLEPSEYLKTGTGARR